MRYTALKFNITNQAISDCCNPRGKSNTGGGFQWSYKKVENLGKREVKRRITKNVIQLDLLGNRIKIWKNATEAGKVLGINYRNICAVCRGNDIIKSAGGYRWIYK